jgi:hypothetical protein
MLSVAPPQMARIIIISVMCLPLCDQYQCGNNKNQRHDASCVYLPVRRTQQAKVVNDQAFKNLTCQNANHRQRDADSRRASVSMTT